MEAEPQSVLSLGAVFSTLIGAGCSVIVFMIQERRRKRVEEDLKKVQSQLDMESKSHQASLDRQLHIARIQFEREHGIYQDLWIKAVSLRRTVFDLRPSISLFSDKETEEQRFDRKSKALNAAYGEFVSALDNSLPFYQREVFEAFERARKVAAKEATQYRLQIEQSRRGEYDPDAIDKADKNHEDLLREIDAACELIRKRFDSEISLLKA